MNGPGLEVVLLGTGAACPPSDRENTSLALVWPGGLWLVDCGASPFRRLRLAGLDPRGLRGVLITHGHPDHLYGLPSLIHCLLPGRGGEPLRLMAPSGALGQARTLLDTFDLLGRAPVPLILRALPTDPGPTAIWAGMGLRLFTAPVAHGLQGAVGLRAEFAGRAFAYTGDSEPCEGVEQLAEGADLLVHEATFRQGERPERPGGHSTAAEAGAAAQRAGASHLLLVHFLEETLRDEAALLQEVTGSGFTGRVSIGADLGRYPV
jgi:ribonuclease Z